MTEYEADCAMQFIAYLDTCVLCGSDLASAMLTLAYQNWRAAEGRVSDYLLIELDYTP